MKKFLIITFLCLSFAVNAQENPDYSAKYSGYIRAWYQSDFGSDQGAYSLKQVRLGISGAVNEYASYKVLVDFTRLGKLTTTTTTVNGVKVVNSAAASFSDILLDAAATITPFKNFDLTAGQFKIPFSSDNLKADQTHQFANRPMITNVSPNMRDIGFIMTYKIKGDVNAELTAGSFNGSGMNKIETDKSLDLSLRAVVSPIKDLNVFANYYGGKVSGLEQNFMGFGLAYKYSAFLFEAEYANKTLSATTGDIKGNSYFAFANYNISFNGGFINEITPAFRYEMFDVNSDKDNNEIGRMTFGLTFQFAKITFAHFRINYEKFDYKDGSTNPDKLILEIQTRF